ncbi:MAG: glycoside hydrolase family 3 protein [Chloroflexi bacterium]|nr:glycoside hydrolase family 3 protein [Chloroflexota bacterium]
MLQLMHSFKGLTPLPEIVDGIRNGQISSFCLFARINVTSPHQLFDLTSALYRAAEEGGQLPPIIGIDQEGGQLMAVTGGTTELPGNMALGAARSVELAEKAGMVLGRELLAMGVNLNFAPSLDVNTNPLNPVIGIRSFGEDPELVGELGAALIRGMQKEGVMATAKHFPGHGDTAFDTHYMTPTITHTRQRTLEVELQPFRVAIAEGVGACMTAHVRFEAFDKDSPATMSRTVLHDLLRNEMGFTGLTITDAMDMHAVNQYGSVNSVRSAIEAGADLILLGHLPDQLAMQSQTYDLLNNAAVQRIQQARMRIPKERPPLSVIGCGEHQQIAHEIAAQSITQLRGKNIPLEVSTDDMIVVITPRPRDLTPADTSADVRISLVDAIRDYHPLVTGVEIDYEAPDEHVRRALQIAENADVVIVGTIAADRDESQAALVRALHERGQAPIVIAMRTPYDITAFPMIENYLCTYSIRAVSMDAAARVLFGKATAPGVLPCSLPV